MMRKQTLVGKSVMQKIIKFLTGLLLVIKKSKQIKLLLESRDKGQLGQISKEELVQKLKKEIEEKK